MRIDKPVIRFLHGISPGLADDWMQKPLVIIDAEKCIDVLGKNVPISEKISRDFWSFGWMPFRRAIYCLDMSPEYLTRVLKLRHQSEAVEYVTKDLKEHSAIFFAVTPEHIIDPDKCKTTTRCTFVTVAKHKVLEWAAMRITKKPIEGYTEPQPTIEFLSCPKDRQATIGDLVVHLCNSIYLWHDWVENGDHYYVEVKNKPRHLNTAKEIKKKPWKNDNYTTIIALNRMPSEHKEHQGGTHASPRGHDRRGYWRRLTHPRFRNHPKYGQKIWIKPTWVGPAEKDYRGKIYRVVDPMPEQEQDHAKNG